MNKVIIERGDVLGNPVVCLRYDGGDVNRYPLVFGIARAELLTQALKEQPDFLEKFLEEKQLCGVI